MTEKVPIPAEEVETICIFSKCLLGEWPEMYTTDKVMMKRYERFSLKNPDYCKLIKEDEYSMTFSVHPKCMGVLPRAPRKGPALTEEQKQANRERLQKSRKARIK